jgi:hypothetical protein
MTKQVRIENADCGKKAIVVEKWATASKPFEPDRRVDVTFLRNPADLFSSHVWDTQYFVVKELETETKMPVPDTMTLTLSKDEAMALKWVLNKVGGHPVRTPRGLVAAINDRLNVEPVSWETLPGKTSLYFGDV